MKKDLCFIIPLNLFNNSAICTKRAGFAAIFEKDLDSNAAPNTGPVPDYSNLYFWASSPFKHDPADIIPAFLKDENRTQQCGRLLYSSDLLPGICKHNPNTGTG